MPPLFNARRDRGRGQHHNHNHNDHKDNDEERRRRQREEERERERMRIERRQREKWEREREREASQRQREQREQRERRQQEQKESEQRRRRERWQQELRATEAAQREQRRGRGGSTSTAVARQHLNPHPPEVPLQQQQQRQQQQTVSAAATICCTKAWMFAGTVLSAPNPQVEEIGGFSAEVFEAGLQNAFGHTSLDAIDALMVKSGFTISDCPLGPAIEVMKNGLYSISLSARFAPMGSDGGNAHFDALFEGDDSDILNERGMAHMAGSRVVAVRVLRQDKIVDTVDGKTECYEVASDPKGWIGNRMASLSVVLPLEKDDRLVLQLWQNSGAPLTAFARFGTFFIH